MSYSVRRLFFLFIGLLLLIASQLRAQSGLTFSKVIDTTIVFNKSNPPTNQIVANLSIPPGKAWKVESAGITSFDTINNVTSRVRAITNAQSSFLTVRIMLGNHMVYRKIPWSQNDAFQYPPKLPVWLSSGNKELIVDSPNLAILIPHGVTLSILEFNVSP